MVSQVAAFSVSDFSLRFIGVSSTRGIRCSDPIHTVHVTRGAGKGRLRGKRFATTMFFRHELGSCLQIGATNSARPGYYLWDAGQGFAFARRGEDRGQGLGGDPFGKRHTVASRGGRAREIADSGAACITPEKIIGKRRREDRGDARGLRAAWMGTEAPKRIENHTHKEKEQVRLVATPTPAVP